MSASGECRRPRLPDLPGVDELSIDVFHAFMRATHLHRQLMLRALSEKGHHIGHIGCLKVLSANEGITQRDLAEMLHLSRPSVTAMLQTLEKAGVVERRADERDQRLTRVHLTAEGREEELQQRQALSEFVNATVGRMPEKDRRDLARLLERMNDYSAEALRGPGAQEGANEPG